MAAAAQAKVKLFKEIEELKRKVAESDGIRVELQECKEELARRDQLQAQLDQWKADFMEGSKHLNKMKRETQEAKDLAMSYKRKLRLSDEKGAYHELEIKKLKDSLKIAEAVRDGTVKKGRVQDKHVKKMAQHTKVHETLRIDAEEELRKTKQFLDQERSFRLQDLHRHNEVMGANEDLEDSIVKLEGEKMAVVKEAVGQRARVRKLRGELEASKLITEVADRDISTQNKEIETLRIDLLELKRVVQEKNYEISVWAKRFIELEGEYNRVQHQLASIATGATARTQTVTAGRLARHGASASALVMARKSASLGGATLRDMGLPQRPTPLSGTAASARRQRLKTPLNPEPAFLTRRADMPGDARELIGRPQTVGTAPRITQPYFDPQAGARPHQSGAVQRSAQLRPEPPDAPAAARTAAATPTVHARTLDRHVSSLKS
eukprot:g5218.t1